MSVFDDLSRVQPKVREALSQVAKAMAGDMVFTVSPATVNRAATSAVWTRYVQVKLTSADGKIHDWFDKDVSSGVSIADTSTAGTATLGSTTLKFKNGQATVTVSGDAAAWLATETDTVTVAALTVMGTTVAAKTSVQTFT